MYLRKDKGLPALKKGDLVEITVNDHHLLVDAHQAGESGRHLVIRGQLAGPIASGQDDAVIRTRGGEKESYLVASVVQSKVASIPVEKDATFLIDEWGKIVNGTMKHH